ncbi:MAG: deoxyribonuclease IV [Phycisphaeraceae bacterium]|nr:deoxyribonuclease IV [Phycisphaeraceae bacterium]
MYGSHLSIAGSMLNALAEAQALGLDTVQVFTKNQQQWHAKPLDQGVVRDWRENLSQLGWFDRTVSHASYLINLASPDDTLWKKSINLMLDEIERCEMLAIPFLVHHPGAYTTSSPEQGIARIAAAYHELFIGTRGYRTVCCLEDTAGSGSHLGRTLEELAALRAAIIDATGVPERIGYCLDSCHLHAGGYDLSTRANAEVFLRRFDAECGLVHLKVVHLNDSKGACGSRVDRHAHIGEGTIGTGTDPTHLAESGFAAFVNHPKLRCIPKILETPKETAPDGRPMDLVNLERLRAIQDSPTPGIPPAPPSHRSSSRPPSDRTGTSDAKPSAKRSSSAGKAPKGLAGKPNSTKSAKPLSKSGGSQPREKMPTSKSGRRKPTRKS